MKKSNTGPTFDHYVPQFLLRKFATNRKKQFYVNVFDKLTGRKFISNINQVMGENDFNSVKIGDFRVRIEEATARIDHIAAPVIARLIDERTTRSLDAQSHAALLMFIALQINRGTGARAMHDDSIDQLKSKLIGQFGIDKVAAFVMGDDTPEQTKLSHLKFSLDSIKVLAESLQRLDVILYQASKSSPFIIGDGPIALHNSQPKTDLYGNLGLMCEGIEVYLPISPTLSLGLLCPSVKTELYASRKSAQASQAKLSTIRTLSPNFDPHRVESEQELFNKACQDLEELIRAFEMKSTVPVSQANVLHQNSLQVSYSERYIISPTGVFHPAEEMIARDGKFRSGPRMIVS